MHMYVQLPEMIESSLRDSPVISCVFDNWTELALPNCWMVAGAVFQTFWNRVYGYSSLHGIDDVDLIYFDPEDLSEDTESDHHIRINRCYDGLGIAFDVKNEARVHLWYEQRFGYPISAYTSVESAIQTFPTTAGAVAVRPKGQRLEAYAPFGFDDLLNLVIRPNKRQITRQIYLDKIARWQPKWPRVEFLPWEDP